MNRLLSYSKRVGGIPFYVIYGRNQKAVSTQCPVSWGQDCGVHFMHASIAEDFADTYVGRKLSRDRLLSESIPLPCISCCPRGVSGFIGDYSDSPKSDQAIPAYVTYLVNVQNGEANLNREAELVQEFSLERFRRVAVYDARERDDA